MHLVDDKKYLTAEEAIDSTIEIANKHSYYCFGKSIKDILIEKDIYSQ